MFRFAKKEAVLLLLIVQYLLVAISIAMVVKSKMIIRGLAKMDENSIEKLEKQKRNFWNQQVKTFFPCAMKDATKVCIV